MHSLAYETAAAFAFPCAPPVEIVVIAAPVPVGYHIHEEDAAEAAIAEHLLCSEHIGVVPVLEDKTELCSAFPGCRDHPVILICRNAHRLLQKHMLAGSEERCRDFLVQCRRQRY